MIVFDWICYRLWMAAPFWLHSTGVIDWALPFAGRWAYRTPQTWLNLVRRLGFK